MTRSSTRSEMARLRWIPLAAILAGCAAAAARACTCVSGETVQAALERSPAVFAGVVREVDGPYPLPTGDGGVVESAREFRFEVFCAWKGVNTKSATVVTGSGGGDCGLDFVLGEAYLVYADRSLDGDRLETSLCTRTRMLIYAGEDSIALGAPSVGLSGGRPWRPFRPGTPCPVHHGSEIRRWHTNIIFGLPRSLDPEYRKVQRDRFPCAGLQIDRPPAATHDEAGRVFRLVNEALVCPECRSGALDWCRRHGARSAIDER